MTDTELAILLRAQLLAGLADIGLPDVEVIANQQPTSQGRADGQAVYFFKVSDPRRGWQSRRNVMSGDVPRKLEEQNVDSTYQFMALAKQSPSDITAPTASDLLNAASMILSSRSVGRALYAQGVGVQVVGDMRNPYFQNARAQFEASPSFDFTVSHRRSIMTATSVIEEINQETHPMEVADGD
jgi:hypothetical protein